MNWIEDLIISTNGQIQHMAWHLPVMAVLTLGLVLSTFYMRTMIRLRTAAIITNVAFLAYGFYFMLWPSIILHGVLLPLNALRLAQMHRAIRQMKSVGAGEAIELARVLPHLKLQRYKAGTVLFRAHDVAETAYYLVEGKINLPDIPATVERGELFGEVGIFSGSQRRTSGAVCETDVGLYAIDRKSITAAFYQNPKFAFFMISLIAERLYSRAAPDQSVTAP